MCHQSRMTLAASVQNVRRPHAVTLLVFGGFGPIAGVFVFGGLQGGLGGMLVFPAFAALGAAILPYKTIGLMFVVAVVPGLLAGLAAHMVQREVLRALRGHGGWHRLRRGCHPRLGARVGRHGDVRGDGGDRCGDLRRLTRRLTRR